MGKLDLQLYSLISNIFPSSVQGVLTLDFPLALDSFKGIVQHFGKYDYLLSRRELDVCMFSMKLQPAAG